MTPHKINFHFKDEFRRAVRDKSIIDSNFHCKEDTCTATFKQKADMFRHLDKFSNTAATTYLSVTSLVPSRFLTSSFSPVAIRSRNELSLWLKHQQQQENCQESLPVSDVSAGVGKVRSSSAADTNQGKMITGVFIAF